MASFPSTRRRRVGRGAIAIAAAVGVSVLFAVVPALDAAKSGKSRHTTSHSKKHHGHHSKSKYLKSLPRTTVLIAAVMRDDDDHPACPPMSSSSQDRSAENQMEHPGEPEHACPPP